MKKGQITVFIIIALVLVGGVILVSVFQRDINAGRFGQPLTQEYLIQMLKTYGEECILEVSKKSGYYEIPADLKIENEDLAFWYLERKDKHPSLSIIKEEIAQCTEDKILALNIPSVKEQIQHDASELDVEVNIKESAIYFALHYPILLKRDDTTIEISDFNVEIGTNFLVVYDSAKVLINNIASSSDFCNAGGIVELDIEMRNDLIYVTGVGMINSKQLNLNFVIDDPLADISEDRKLAVLYQDNEDWPTFGGVSASILQEILGNEDIDYFPCDSVGSFINNINNYDYAIITGRLQYQILNRIDKSMLYGCSAFDNSEKKLKLKNWVANGGVLWINDVSKHESDMSLPSYIGSLGYKAGRWDPLGTENAKETIQERAIEIEKERKIVTEEDIADKEHQILTCPNDIVSELGGTWVSDSLEVTEEDEIIIGTKRNAFLWTRKIGRGVIIFDEFLMKDNLLERLDYEDDIYSKGIAEDYFENVLLYMAGFDS